MKVNAEASTQWICTPGLCSVVLVQSSPCQMMDSPWQQGISSCKAVWGKDFSSHSLSDSDKHISKISMQQHYHAIPGAHSRLLSFSYKGDILSWHASTYSSSSCYQELYCILELQSSVIKAYSSKSGVFSQLSQVFSFVDVHFFQHLTMYQLHRSMEYHSILLMVLAAAAFLRQ